MSHLSPEHRRRRVESIDRAETDPSRARFRIWRKEGPDGRTEVMTQETIVMSDVHVGGVLTFMVDDLVHASGAIRSIVDAGNGEHEIFTDGSAYTIHKIPSAELSVHAERDIAARVAAARGGTLTSLKHLFWR